MWPYGAILPPSVLCGSRERHLGHIVSAGDCWLAFDTTHFNEAGTGFRLLGSWTDIALAKCAVELAIAKR